VLLPLRHGGGPFSAPWAGSGLSFYVVRLAGGIPITYTGERAVPGRGDHYAFQRIHLLVSERYGAPRRDALDYGCGTGNGALLRTQEGPTQSDSKN